MKFLIFVVIYYYCEAYALLLNLLCLIYFTESDLERERKDQLTNRIGVEDNRKGNTGTTVNSKEENSYSIINEDSDLDEEKETFLSKLYETYGTTSIIFLGVLIFMTCLCLMGMSWCFISRSHINSRSRQSSATNNRLSPSIHTRPPIAEVDSL